MNSNSRQETFTEHLLCSRAWSISSGDVSQTRQKSSSSERGHSSKGAGKLQSEVNGVKPRRRMKGRQEGFSEEVLCEQTLTEGREEARQVSGEKHARQRKSPCKGRGRTVLGNELQL